MRKNTTNEISPKEVLRHLLIFFIATIVTVLLFMMIAVYMNQANGPMLPQWKDYTMSVAWLVAGVSLLSFVIARQQLKRRSGAAKDSLNTLSDKLKKYRRALVLYLALCEAPALLSIVLFELTGNFIFLAYAAVMLGFMLSVTPVRRRVIAALELNWEQQKELD